MSECDICKYYEKEDDRCLFSYMGNGDVRYAPCYITQYEDGYADGQRDGQMPKWIPVTEALPEDGERVLITHKGGVSFGWHNGSYWERGAPTNHRPLETVIAWMPLPEPWRGDR